MEENKVNQQLFELISSKSFDALNENEKKSVLAEMTEEEYRAMFELQHSITHSLQQDSVSTNDSVKSKLLQFYDGKYSTAKRQTGIASLLLLKIPLCQAAAAVLTALLISSAIYYFNLSAINNTQGVSYKVKTDTIFVKTDEKKQSNVIPSDSLAINNPDHSSFQQHNHDEIKTCRSIKQDNDLKQFMVASL